MSDDNRIKDLPMSSYDMNNQWMMSSVNHGNHDPYYK